MKKSLIDLMANSADKLRNIAHLLALAGTGGALYLALNDGSSLELILTITIALVAEFFSFLCDYLADFAFRKKEDLARKELDAIHSSLTDANKRAKELELLITPRAIDDSTRIEIIEELKALNPKQLIAIANDTGFDSSNYAEEIIDLFRKSNYSIEYQGPMLGVSSNLRGIHMFVSPKNPTSLPVDVVNIFKKHGLFITVNSMPMLSADCINIMIYKDPSKLAGSQA